MGKDKPVILFLFNSSRYAVDPWLNDGRFYCVSVDHDGDTSDHAGGHRERWRHERHARLDVDLSRADGVQLVKDKLDALCLRQPSMVISFAPCTDLAVAGAKHFARKRQANPHFQQDAVTMARCVEHFHCPYIVENPVSVLASLWRKPTGYVHPHEFAIDCPTGPHPEFPDIIPPMDLYHKKTGLWCGNGAVMPEKSNHHGVKGSFPGWEKLGGKSARTKYIRSLTPRGLARALYKANAPLLLQKSLTNA